MKPPAPWALIDIDLADRLEVLKAPTGATAVLTVFRLSGAVLGYGYLLPSELPMSTTDLACLAARSVATATEQWRRLGPGYGIPPTPNRPKSAPIALPLPTGNVLAQLQHVIRKRRARPVRHTASIVICTHKRPQALAGCLAAIAPEIAARREVIVVDNDPDAESEAVVRAVAGVSYVREPCPGLSRARNAGIAAATGEIVVFVDDDVRPESGWADALLQAFDNDAVAIVCGLALPDALETEAQIAFQYKLGFGGMQLAPLRFDAGFLQGWRRGVPVWQIGAGANMAVRRSTALQLGGFDERIGPGAAGGCGDDSEFWHRALFSGAVIHYEPLSIVRHQHRRGWSNLKRQAQGYGFGHVVALFVQHARDRDHGDLARVFLTLPHYYARRLLRTPFRRWLRGDPDRLLWSEIRGYLAGLARLRLAFSLGTREPDPP